MKYEKVSVIVPVYNVEEYLPDTIESIINQTYGDIEIILVDDGSTDQSGAIIDEYAQRDTRIKPIHKKNAGVSAARNTGFTAVDSNLVMFLDADDLFDSNMIAEMRQVLVDGNCDFVVGSIETFDSDSGKPIWKQKIKNSNGKRIEVCDYAKSKSDINFSRTNVGAPMKMYRKSFLDKHDMLFNEKILRSAEDVDFHVRSFIYADRIGYVNKPYYKYRVNTPTSSTMVIDKYYDEIMTAMKSSEEYIRKAKLYKTLEKTFINFCVDMMPYHLQLLIESDRHHDEFDLFKEFIITHGVHKKAADFFAKPEQYHLVQLISSKTYEQYLRYELVWNCKHFWKVYNSRSYQFLLKILHVLHKIKSRAKMVTT